MQTRPRHALLYSLMLATIVTTIPAAAGEPFPIFRHRYKATSISVPEIAPQPLMEVVAGATYRSSRPLIDIHNDLLQSSSNSIEMSSFNGARNTVLSTSGATTAQLLEEHFSLQLGSLTSGRAVVTVDTAGHLIFIVSNPNAAVQLRSSKGIALGFFGFKVI